MPINHLIHVLSFVKRHECANEVGVLAHAERVVHVLHQCRNLVYSPGVVSLVDGNFVDNVISTEIEIRDRGLTQRQFFGAHLNPQETILFEKVQIIQINPL